MATAQNSFAGGFLPYGRRGSNATNPRGYDGSEEGFSLSPDEDDSPDDDGLFRTVIAETPEAEKYVKLIMDLQPYVEKLDLPVPIIVVFGDQSAGKSALIRRLTDNLPIPRGANRCTTGPIEIRMIKSQRIRERSVSFRFVEDKNGKPINMPEFKFCSITGRSPNDIEQLLKLGQVLVRNPTRTLAIIEKNPQGAETALTVLAEKIQLQDDSELKFTNNVICITISSPDQKFSLALVDLPGLVRDRRDDEVMVESMVQRYIMKEHTILLPIFNINNDIQNQSAWKLLKDEAEGADKEGTRTVGVLSRADELSPSNDISSKCAALFRGETEHNLSHGFYLIKNPSTEEVENGSNTDELERDTINAVLNRPEWRGVPRERMGLGNLVTVLSRLQMRALQSVMASTIAKLEAERSKMAAELKVIQPPKGDPISAFIENIDRFATLFRDNANTDALSHRLYQGQLWNVGQYDRAICKTCPLFSLHQSASKDDPIFDPVKLGILQPDTFTETIKREINAESWSDEYRRRTWNAEQVREILVEEQGGLLLGYFPYKAVVAIVQEHTKDWKDYANKLLDKNYEWVKTFVNNLAKKEFGTYNPRVIGEIESTLTSLLVNFREETRGHIEDLHEMERVSASRSLFVTNEAKYMHKSSKYFMEIRVRCFASHHDKAQLRHVLAQISEIFDMMNGRKQTSPAEFNNLKKSLLHSINTLTDPKSFVTHSLLNLVSNFVLPQEGQTSLPTFQLMYDQQNKFVSSFLQATVPKKSPTPVEGLSLHGDKPSSMDINMSLNLITLAETQGEQAFLAAAGALAYWKMIHERFRETVPRSIEYHLVHRFARQIRNGLMNRFNLLRYQPQSSITRKPEYGTDFDPDYEEPERPDVEEMLLEPREVKARRELLNREYVNISNVITHVREFPLT